MRRVRCPVFPLLSSLLLTVGLAGCARSGHEPPVAGARQAPPTALGADTLARALEATRAVPTGRLEVTTTLARLDEVPDAPPGGRVTVAVHRVSFDRAGDGVAVETDMSAVAAVLDDEGAGPAGDLSVPARMVAGGDVVYAQGGPFAAAVGRAPASWVRLDRARLVEQQPESDTARLVLDPLGPFGVVGEAVGDVRAVGQDQVRGVPVTHVATELSAGTGGGAAALDVWIDADDVIRRLELRQGGEMAGEVVTRAELFDVGGAVDITVPPDG